MVYYDMATTLRERQKVSGHNMAEALHERSTKCDDTRASSEPSRFSIGDMVECNCGGWKLGHVSGLIYSPLGMTAPALSMAPAYQVRLADSGLTITVAEAGDLIRLPVRSIPTPGHPDERMSTPTLRTPQLGEVDILLDQMQAGLLKARLLTPVPAPAVSPTSNSEVSHQRIRASSAGCQSRVATYGQPLTSMERDEVARRLEHGEHPHRIVLQSTFSDSKSPLASWSRSDSPTLHRRP
mmetsp:Transcript_78692/g.156470  ORF Transcript_78692/g.156470 Transcript_78692/m.156470 type:complete len:239 (-) Transcript_78692:221-937(-)